MDENKLIQTTFNFAYCFIEKFFYKEKVYSIGFFKDKSKGPMSSFIINVFLDAIYVPNEILPDGMGVDELMEGYLSPECRMMDEVYKATFFNSSAFTEVSKVKAPSLFQKKSIDYLGYQKYIRSTVSSDKKSVSLRMSPWMCEKQSLKTLVADGWTIKFPFGSKDKSIGEITKSTEAVATLVTELIKSYKAKKGQMITDPESEKDDFSSLKALSESAVINDKKVLQYLKVRHNFFGKMCLTVLGKETSKLDMSPRDIGYSGEFERLTPDFIDVRPNLIVIVEFAVTDEDPATVEARKKIKYDDLAKDMERVMKKKVVLEVCVYCASDPKASLLPDTMKNERLLILESCKPLRDTYLRMSSNEKYREIKTRLEKFRSEESMIKKELVFEAMTQELLKTNTINGKKAVNLSFSREAHDQSKRPVFVSNEDDEIVKGMKVDFENSDETKTTHAIVSSLKETCEKGLAGPKMTAMLNLDRRDLVKEIDKVLNDQKTLAVDQRDKVSLPKMFKYPLIRSKESLPFIDPVPSKAFLQRLEDGTVILNDWEKTDDAEVTEENRPGIGIDFDEDVGVVEAFRLMLAQDHDQNRDLTDNPAENFLNAHHLGFVFGYVSDLYKNIAYLEGRRKDKDSGKKSNSFFTVYKKFDGYSLMIKSGSAATKEKSIRFKVWTTVKNSHDAMNLHSWRQTEYADWVSTKWLTATVTDIGHFSTIKETASVLMSHLYDTMLETSNPSSISFAKMNFMFPMLVLLEHKRSTSTTLQNNRYVIHSGTSLFSDKKGLISTILSEPTRSFIDSYSKIAQLRWFRMVNSHKDPFWKTAMERQKEKQADYDRLFLPSLFDRTEVVEFSFSMNEMYYGNLFCKEHGFTSHRVKAIVKKMVAEERNFLKVREKEESIGNVKDYSKFFTQDDVHHTFDKDFVFSASKRLSKKLKDTGGFMEMIFKSISSTMKDAMKLTSSLEGIPEETFNHAKSTSWTVKDYSFNTLRKKISELGTSNLLAMVTEWEMIEAYFDMFPKSQIGGPREILIMAVVTRLQVKLVETLAHNLCSLHDKEMLTKDKKKTDIQSNTLLSMKSALAGANKKNVKAVMFSINSDATKWAPSMVMEQLLCFVLGLGLPDDVTDFMLTVIRSFSTKRIFLPKALKEKWMKKPSSEKEADEDLEWFRALTSKSEWRSDIHSGMGQGMLHFLSSLYHCAIDDYMDFLTKQSIPIAFETKTLISSDDKTKMIILSYRNPKNAILFMRSYILTYDAIQRLGNCHTNWKKTAFQSLITEFNSIFSINKRMVSATIKDIYTSTSVVDMSFPEQAVREVLSNIRRAFLSGAYLTTVELAMRKMRQHLMDCFTLSGPTSATLCTKLECKEDLLPFHLGYLPLALPVETLVYGPDLHCFNPLNSQKLKNFYSGLYTAIGASADVSKEQDNPLREPVTGRFSVELPLRLDKRVLEMKENFYSTIQGGLDSVLSDLNKNALMINQTPSDLDGVEHFINAYMVSLNRRYEFQETMKIHSLVRALSIARGKILCKLLSDESMFLSEFVDACLARKEKKSTLGILVGLSSIWDSNVKIQKDIMDAHPQRITRHPKIRNIRFFTSEITEFATEQEIMKTVCGNFEGMSSRIYTSLSKMLEAFSVKFSDFAENPPKYIKKMFPNSSKPFIDFTEYVSYTRNVVHQSMIRMNCDFPDTGSMYWNLLNLYAYRSNPEFVYQVGQSVSSEMKSLEFQSWISLFGNNTSNVSEYFKAAGLPADQHVFSTKDSVLDLAMKMTSLISDDGFRDFDKITCSRVLYRDYYDKDTLCKFLTDFELFVKISVKEKEKKTYVEIYSSSDHKKKGADKPIMFDCLIRELSLSSTHQIFYKLGSKFIQTDISSDSFPVNQVKLILEKKFKFTSNKWSLDLVFSELNRDFRRLISRFRFCTFELSFIPSHLQAEKFSVVRERLNTLYSKNSGIMEVYEVLKDMKWLPKFDKKFEVYDQKGPDDSEEIQKTFSEFIRQAITADFQMQDFNQVTSSRFEEEEDDHLEAKEEEDQKMEPEIELDIPALSSKEDKFGILDMLGNLSDLQDFSNEAEEEIPMDVDKKFVVKLVNDAIQNCVSKQIDIVPKLALSIPNTEKALSAIFTWMHQFLSSYSSHLDPSFVILCTLSLHRKIKQFNSSLDDINKFALVDPRAVAAVAKVFTVQEDVSEVASLAYM